jgi:hypothetical protein
MIITLICLALIVAGIIFVIIDSNVSFKKWKTQDCIEILKITCLIIGGMATIVVGTLVLVNACNYDIEYKNAIHQREMLEYRIDRMEDNITGNEMLYNDIVTFNNMLRSEKKWALNPWTSWFNNAKIATIDYIEIPKLNEYTICPLTDFIYN